jgi:hypothetical protein
VAPLSVGRKVFGVALGEALFTGAASDGMACAPSRIVKIESAVRNSMACFYHSAALCVRMAQRVLALSRLRAFAFFGYH